ncbi:MAG: hypothetical protein ACREJN_09065, partial [Nitrospiraceae bacterium]
MGGFLGIGNSSAKTDRGNQLAGVSADWNVYNKGLDTAQKQLPTGMGNEAAGAMGLDTASNYWRGITQGNRTSLTSAAAPVANAALDTSDAAKREQATMGTGRGGGVNAANQQAQTQTQKNITDATQAAQGAGAQQLGAVSTQQANVGHQQLTEALQSLGLSADVAKEIIDSSRASRETSLQ